MTQRACSSNCGRPASAGGKLCAPCREGNVPTPDPRLHTDEYLAQCVQEVMRRGRSAVSDAIRELAARVR